MVHMEVLGIGVAVRVRAAGGLVVLDCGHPREGVEELLGVADIAILSHTYPGTLRGEGCDPREFLADLFGRIPGHRVESVDSTGAGDVFHGAFVHAFLQGDSPVEAARFANAAAALGCEGMSGRFPLPPEAEIRRFSRAAGVRRGC